MFLKMNEKKMKDSQSGTALAVQSRAKVVDGKLILTFTNAITPVIWQMDLVGAKASALLLSEQDGVFSLVLKTPKGETLHIAPFKTQDLALQALMVASDALENAQGQIRPSAPAAAAYHAPSYEAAMAANMASPRGQKPRRWGRYVLGAMALLLAILVWMNISVQNRQQAAVQSAANSASVEMPQQAEPGVPLSADDFLRRQ